MLYIVMSFFLGGIVSSVLAAWLLSVWPFVFPNEWLEIAFRVTSALAGAWLISRWAGNRYNGRLISKALWITMAITAIVGCPWVQSRHTADLIAPWPTLTTWAAEAMKQDIERGHSVETPHISHLLSFPIAPFVVVDYYAYYLGHNLGEAALSVDLWLPGFGTRELWRGVRWIT